MRIKRALAALAAGLLLGACDGQAVTSDPSPSETPTTSPPTSTGTHGSVRPRPRQLVQLAFGRAEGRAAVWRSCTTRRCARPEWRVTTTADAFRTSYSVALPRHRILDLTPAGHAGFVVRQDFRPAWLLYFDSTVHRIRTRGPARPVAPGEVVVPGARGGLVAVNTDTAVAHPVPTPPRFHDLTRARGQLRGITDAPSGHSTYVVSSDGGRSWRPLPLPARHALWMPVAEGRAPALVQGADGATLFPFVATWRAGSDTFARTAGPTDPTAYVSCAHRLRDGRLFLCVDAWSDQRRGKVPTPPGFWVSKDARWADFVHVEPGAPFDDDEVFQPVVVGEHASADGLLLVVTDPETGRAWSTRDLGRTFEEIAVR